MNRFIDQTKFFLIGIFLLVAVNSHSQSVLSVSGQVLLDDGSPAIEAGLLLIFDDIYYYDFTNTDANGNYNFSINLDEGYEEGCFTILLIDCDGAYIPHEECYTSDNSTFEKDFLFCENGIFTCNTFVIVTPSSTSEELVLSTFNIGLGPFNYLWSDGSQESTNTVSILFEGEICVTVTDAQECESSNCITLEPDDPCFVFISEQNGYQGVILQANGFGQTGEIGYLWSTGEEGEQILITESGEYCVLMTDELGCESFDCINVTVDSTAWLDCFAEIHEILNSDGNIESLIAEGFGASPYTFLWIFEGIAIGDSETIVPNFDGEYCVIINDSTNCSYTTCYDYTYTVDCFVYIDCPEEGSGELVAITNGVEPIIYNWSNGDEGPYTTVETSGEYCVTIVDGLGCESDFCHTVTIDPAFICDGNILTHFVDDTSALLSVHIPSGEGSSNALYTWSTGEETPYITVNEAGLYCVTVTLDDSCTFDACTYFSVDGLGLNHGLVITYFDSNQSQGMDAEIELYKVEDGYIYLYDIIQEWALLNIQGLFFTDDIVEGTYLVRAKPNNSDQYIPSYSMNSPFWDESDYFSVVNGGIGLANVINIQAIPLNDVKGEGQISGVAWSYEFNENIMLFFDSEVVGQAYTDMNGEFSFNSLPYGTYTVVRERPGLLRDEVIVTISANDPFVNDVTFDELIAVVNDNSELDIQIFPNPTANFINISSDKFSSETGYVTLFDVDGKSVVGYDNIPLAGDLLSLDLSNVAQGIYFVKIQIGTTTEVKRIIKI